jgi:DNA transposition AAA+ family ATPase
MQNDLKKQIRDALEAKIERLGISQNEAAKRIGVSAATITNILKGKNWDKITGAFTKVQIWVQDDLSVWNKANTQNFNKVWNICAHAQLLSESKAISFKPGTGKSYAAKQYQNEKANVFYVCAYGDMGKRHLLQKLCKEMGIDQSYRLAEMIEDIIDKLGSIQKPLIIIDEFDELDPKAMRLFKDIYNRCKVGFVIIGGLHLKKFVLKGVRNHSQSMQETYSRLGGQFHALENNDYEAIKAICVANGIHDAKKIQSIASQANGDLRRVEAAINKERLTQLVNLQKQQQHAND